MSLSTFSINNKPIENKTNREAKPSCGEEKIKAIPEKDVDRTSAEGKASSVQFIHFNFSEEKIKKIKNFNNKIMLFINHDLYKHEATISQDSKNELVKDFI